MSHHVFTSNRMAWIRDSMGSFQLYCLTSLENGICPSPFSSPGPPYWCTSCVRNWSLSVTGVGMAIFSLSTAKFFLGGKLRAWILKMFERRLLHYCSCYVSCYNAWWCILGKLGKPTPIYSKWYMILDWKYIHWALLCILPSVSVWRPLWCWRPQRRNE